MSKGSMHGREAFIRNIASRLGRKEPLSAAPVRNEIGVPPHAASLKLTEEERFRLFAENWSALTGRMKRVRRDEASQAVSAYVGELAQEFGVTRIARWDEKRLNALDLDGKLRGQGLEVVVWRKDGAAHDSGRPFTPRLTATDENGAPAPGKWARREPLLQAVEQCQMGIVWPEAVIANTGSLVLFADPGHGRSVSLVTDVLVAVFERSQIVARMGEAFALMKERYGSVRNIPSSVNIITGPSRSADIENDLTIGIHGPGKVVAIIIED